MAQEQAHTSFELLETMLWDGEIVLQSFHLDRLQASAAHFGWPFERSFAEPLLQEHIERTRSEGRHVIRLTLNKDGRILLESTPVIPLNVYGQVCVAQERSSSEDELLRHRTTQRPMYDRLYLEARAQGCDDVLFLNERGEVTEGAVHSLFIQKAGRLVTSPVRCGLLPGVYRRHLLETRPDTEERALTLEDVRQADAVFLTDSVHGMTQTKVLGF